MARRNRSFFFDNKSGKLESDGKVVVDASNTTNILQTKGSTTGNPVALNAIGDDTNITINIGPKGSGLVQISSAYTLPKNDGTNGQVLSTNGSGALSFQSLAATDVTVSANNSTDETTYITFVDGATGSQGLETDTGLTYNPSSGLLTTAEVDVTTLKIGSTSITASATELNYVDGVTSSIQTQLDAKAPTASPTFTGTVGTNGGFRFGASTSYLYESATDRASLRVGADGPYVILGQDLGSNVSALGNASGPLALYANNAEVMRLSSGKVGIGNTAPASPLTIAGVIESTSGGVKFPDGTTQTSAASAGITEAQAIEYAIALG